MAKPPKKASNGVEEAIDAGAHPVVASMERQHSPLDRGPSPLDRGPSALDHRHSVLDHRHSVLDRERSALDRGHVPYLTTAASWSCRTRGT